MYYKNQYNANFASKHDRGCVECGHKKLSILFRGRKIHWADKLKKERKKGAFTKNHADERNPRAKTILDTFTNKIYKTMKSVTIEFGFSIDILRRMIKNGDRFKYVGQTNAPANKY